jgi:hypothetical protein
VSDDAIGMCGACKKIELELRRTLLVGERAELAQSPIPIDVVVTTYE